MGALGLVVAGVALSSCTLTQDDYAPSVAESGTLVPDGSVGAGGSAGGGPSVSAGCASAADCPPGDECSAGQCVPRACLDGEDVASCINPCLEGVCAVEQCGDGVLGPGEVDIDCGGPCSPCADGAVCTLDADCAAGACVEQRCAAPSCSDGRLNQDESAPDCGGASCARCGAGLACGGDSDCEAGLACLGSGGVCAAATCDDGIHNGAETALDCGGGCPGCADGSPCAVAADCSSGSCTGDVCAAPSCADGVANGEETDLDCGGPCGVCPLGGACAGPADCESGVCDAVGCADGAASCCQPATCADGVRNGGESAVDCGSDACQPCADGATCSAAAQCASNVCLEGTCQRLCGDGDQNGDETGADCGGSELGCPRCEDGEACGSGADCESGRCDEDAVCSSCSDGSLNGDEDDVDCGSGEPGCPACPRCNEGNSTNLGGAGAVTALSADACAQITIFPSYSPSLLESIGASGYPVPFSWSQECSGESGSAVFISQFQQVSLGDLTTDCPIIVELGGDEEAFALRWY